MDTNNKIELTGVFVQDPKTNRFTAFFAQFPNIIAEGDNEQEATLNLFTTFQTVFEYNKNTELESEALTMQTNITTKPFHFSQVA